ncbi:hypothetical protein [Rosistilla oblonga]|uniref:Uncharacterized protein n=1 Tax=Rosistilla oblonga TaxID=2527990 RepID=A0A518ITJ1_9BACT|nr:hypothetical protein [Rosistilla oblonga]QDV56403.1 hypothetical protein Mal33_23930 [Rosistilla oblonga]
MNPTIAKLTQAVDDLPEEHARVLRPIVAELVEEERQAIAALADVTLAGQRMMHETQSVKRELAAANRKLAGW